MFDEEEAGPVPVGSADSRESRAAARATVPKHLEDMAGILSGKKAGLERASLLEEMLEEYRRHLPGWAGITIAVEVVSLRHDLDSDVWGNPRRRAPSDAALPGDRAPKTQAEALAELASEGEFFHDEQGESYATITVGTHRETHRVRGLGFRLWLVRLYRQETGKVPNREPLKTALQALEARARFDGQERHVFTRVGWDGSSLWIDLCDPEWRAVRVDGNGWEVVHHADVCFVRGKAMRALPEPVRGGSLASLAPLLNASSTEDPHFILAVAWLIGAFHPYGPYPGLYLVAEQGSGKSVGAGYLRSLVDPSVVGLRAPPRDERDLITSAKSSWVLGFDNLSSISDWLSDALCRLSTGGGFGTRTLYTDDEETLFTGRRPVLMNGIPLAVAEPDLRDRVLVAHWPRLLTRRRDADLARQFIQLQPAIFGAILNAVAAAVPSLAARDIDGANLPRLADFTSWVEAAEPRLPWRRGLFGEVFAASRESAAGSALAESLVAQAVIGFSASAHEWEGTATGLLEILSDLVLSALPPGRRLGPEWPRSPRSLSAQLRRLTPDLRTAGVWVSYEKVGKSRDRMIRISQASPDISRNPASAPPFESATSAVVADAADDTGAKSVDFSSCTPNVGVEPIALTAELDLSAHFASYGLDQYEAFPDTRFHGVIGGAPKVILVSRATGQAMGRPWGIAFPTDRQEAGDTSA